jgi:hypothetical protein|tara:strand:- start:667 stop:948 length:282 start_codon:yes stop_codon:yes gene_type:complete
MEEDDVDVSDIDMKGMFRAKMGFDSDEVPLDDAQLERFLLLCHQAYLQEEGLMESEDDYSEVEEDADVKVVKIHSGDVHGMMDKLLGPMKGGY